MPLPYRRIYLHRSWLGDSLPGTVSRSAADRALPEIRNDTKPLDIEGGRQHSGNADDALGHYRGTLELIAGCDALIANMTPFRGPGLDAATALEMGVMAGYGRPIVGYSMEAQSYKDRLPICSRKSKKSWSKRGAN